MKLLLLKCRILLFFFSSTAPKEVLEYYKFGSTKLSNVSRKYYVKDGLMTGQDSLFWIHGGVKGVFSWKKGKVIGQPMMYNKDGSIKYRGEVKNDTLYFYNTEDQLIVCGIKTKDDWEGNVRNYSDQGVLKMKYTKTNGKYEGVFQSWHDNGNLQRYKEYKNGEVVGMSHRYYENGNLSSSRDYNSPYRIRKMKNGLIRETIFYDEDLDHYLILSYKKDGTFMIAGLYREKKALFKNNKQDYDAFINGYRTKCLSYTKEKEAAIRVKYRAELEENLDTLYRSHYQPLTDSYIRFVSIRESLKKKSLESQVKKEKVNNAYLIHLAETKKIINNSADFEKYINRRNTLDKLWQLKNMIWVEGKFKQSLEE